MHIVLQEPEIDGVSMQIGIDEIVVRRRTAAGQELLIAETSAYGRTLFLDGLVQSAEADEPLYHEPLVHPALVIHGGPRRVLVGGTGEGASLREILRHRAVEQIVTVDLDPEVVALCKEHLPAWSAGSLDDPRVEQRTEDIRRRCGGAAGRVRRDLPRHHRPGRGRAERRRCSRRGSSRRWRARWPTTGSRCCSRGSSTRSTCGCRGRSAARCWRCSRGWCSRTPTCRRFTACGASRWSAKRPFALVPADLEARIAGSGRCKVYTPTAHRAMLELPPYLQARLEQPGPVITGDGRACCPIRQVHEDMSMTVWSRTNQLIVAAAQRLGAGREALGSRHTDYFVRLVQGERSVIVSKTRSPFLTQVAQSAGQQQAPEPGAAGARGGCRVCRICCSTRAMTRAGRRWRRCWRRTGGWWSSRTGGTAGSG
jgi:hypothetical protein